MSVENFPASASAWRVAVALPGGGVSEESKRGGGDSESARRAMNGRSILPSARPRPQKRAVSLRWYREGARLLCVRRAQATNERHNGCGDALNARGSGRS